jgi:hypothetical protein
MFIGAVQTELHIAERDVLTFVADIEDGRFELACDGVIGQLFLVFVRELDRDKGDPLCHSQRDRLDIGESFSQVLKVLGKFCIWV